VVKLLIHRRRRPTSNSGDKDLAIGSGDWVWRIERGLDQSLILKLFNNTRNFCSNMKDIVFI